MLVLTVNTLNYKDYIIIIKQKKDIFVHSLKSTNMKILMSRGKALIVIVARS